MKKYIKYTLLILFLFTGCKKFVEIDTLTDKLLAGQVFESDITANAATAGIYRQMRTSNLINSISFYNGFISDELIPYVSSTMGPYLENKLQADDTTLPWSSLYAVLYSANGVIEGLTDNKSVTEKARAYYLAEAKFCRALCYFYLVNYYGDVPLVLSTDVKTNSVISRSPVSEIYTQILSDLKDAQSGLGNDYSFTGGERSRANKWAATALLARVYLYRKDWVNAEAQATAVINSGQYALLNSPAGIFNKNNTEAIFQLANNSTEQNNLSTLFIYTTTPLYLSSSFLLNAFEANDLRKTTWIKTAAFSGTTVSIPYKFTTTTAGSSEWYTVMRLAEQYLIRAEARAMRDDFEGAINDVNLIRQKHGGLNTGLPVPADQTRALDIILHERQVDLFTEGSHRWFDLKRTGRLDAVMLLERPDTWTSSAALYPILKTDITRNSNLKQNPGYE